MKVLFILSAVLLATAQANIFTDIGQNLANVFKTLGASLLKQLDTTGVDLLNAGVTAGKTLISQGIQALALNTANALQGSTREIKLPPALQNVESSLHNVVDTLIGEMKNIFGFLVKGLQGVVDKLTQLEITPEEVISEVDKFVNVHNLVADSFLKTIKDKAEEVISSLIKSKRNAFTNLFAGIGESLTKTFQPVVDGVKTLSIGAGSAIKTGATSLLEHQKQQAKLVFPPIHFPLPGRRPQFPIDLQNHLPHNLTALLQEIHLNATKVGQKLQPHIANLGSQLGTILANGSNALGALKAAGGDILHLQNHLPHNLTALLQEIHLNATKVGQKLQPHIANLGSQLGTILANGSNALDALKAAGGDILQQTLTNLKEPLNNIGQTVVDAGQTVVGHVAGALLGTNTDPTTTIAPST